MRPRIWQPSRLPCPWDSPGKNTGVGCHFLLQCMKVKSESEVSQSCLTLHNPMDCSLPGSSVHGSFQARVLEWVAIAFSMWVSYSLFDNIFTQRRTFFKTEVNLLKPCHCLTKFMTYFKSFVVISTIFPASSPGVDSILRN